MRKIAICDDNKKAREFLETECRDFYKNEIDICQFETGEDILLARKHFDIIFMDIEMDNLNGLETVAEIRKTDIDVIIIFISGYKNYKFNAYPLHAFDFLDKPIDKIKLFEVLTEVEIYCNKKTESIYVSFKINNGFLNFDVNDIIYFVYEERKIKVVSRHGDYIFNDNITDLYEKMRIYDFSIVHRAFLVNLKHIIKIDGNEIVLDNNQKVPVSRYKMKDFKNDYSIFLAKHINEWED